MPDVGEPPAAPAEWRVWLALWTVYIVWGSTYIGIRVMDETIPPMVGGATRFLAVGVLLGGFLLLRRRMLDELGGLDEGFRLYGEDIDLCYRAAKAGWERWYVPAAVVHHDYAAVIDKKFLTRHTLWHARAMARFLRKHPERLLALR